MNKAISGFLSLGLTSIALLTARAQTPASTAAQPTSPPPATVTPLAPLSTSTDLAPATNEPPKAVTETPAAKPAAKPKAHRAATGVRGQIGLIDTTNLTFTVTGKKKSSTFQVTSRTHFFKDGKPATFGDAKEGETVTVFSKPAKKGKTPEATTVRIGGKSDGASGSGTKSSKKSRKASSDQPAAAGSPAQ